MLRCFKETVLRCFNDRSNAREGLILKRPICPKDHVEAIARPDPVIA
jgi:hypothetical protein